MWKLGLAGFLAAGALSAQVSPHFVTAQQWLAQYDGSDRGGALSYAQGTADASMFFMGLTTEKIVCLPDNATTGQLAAVGKRHIEDTPSVWNEPASVILLAAWSKTWPCNPG